MNAKNLRDALASIYPDMSSARRVVMDAGIEPARINFDGSALNVWHAILDECEKSERTNALIQVALAEYGRNQELLFAIHEIGYEFPTVGDARSSVCESSGPTDLDLAPQEQEILYQALLDAFDHSSLERMVRFGLGENLTTITQGTNHADDVFNLVVWAIRQGRLVELVRAACAHNPTNPKLKNFCSGNLVN